MIRKQVRRPFIYRREFLRVGLMGGGALAGLSSAGGGPSIASEGLLTDSGPARPASPEQGAQRLKLGQLHAWEALGYGMFLHFGISTFTQQEWADGKAPASIYNPDRLAVDQWIQIARDAGMKYAVLTTKHVGGHCLWPSRFTDYTVTHSGNTTDVVEAFVKACEKRGVRPGLYYCSLDNHHLFGSVTVDHAGLPYDTVEQVHFIEKNGKAFTSSFYQDFETNQVTELLTQYGPITEVWIDEPGVLGSGYRTFLYEHIASLQPEAVIVMNGSYGDTQKWDPWFTWPQDVIGYEQYVPPLPRHVAWRNINGKRYCLGAEVYDVIGSGWFYHEKDKPKSDAELLKLHSESRQRGANLLLDVPPDKHGLIPREYSEALMRLRRSARL